MFKNIYFDTKKSIVYIWETVKGNNMFDSIEWSPFLFENDPDGKIKTIFENSVSKIDFNHYNDYYKYSKSNNDCYENNVRPEIQFLSSRYYGISDDDLEVPKLRIYSIDIECHSEEGFPHAENAEYPVVVCSLYDCLENKTITFGINDYTGEYSNEDFLNYYHCKTEEDLLISIFNWFQKKPADIITGWNVIDFDIQYLINRAKKVFGDNTDVYRRLSPIGVVRTWKSASEEFNVDIAGVTILDYMSLYKWYSPNKLEKYTLDFVCKFELEKGKVDYSEQYQDIRELYSDWNLYVKYNITDALRVGQLENKLGYIKLVQALSLLCKAPMKYYNSMTQLIEGLLLTYYRRTGYCAPRFMGGQQETFDAAYVKEPHVGRYDWIIDLDIVSSYPTAVVTMNMSLESYYGRIKGYTEQEMIYNVQRKRFDDFNMIMSNDVERNFNGKQLEVFNKALDKKLLSIAPCGSVFTTSKAGVIANITRQLFSKRVEIKGNMINLKKSIPSLKDDALFKTKEKIAQLHSYQLAVKIILNAIFGITSVPYSRYFNKNIAEAIVSCGRNTRASGEKFVNELLNNPNDDLKLIIKEMENDIKNM